MSLICIESELTILMNNFKINFKQIAIWKIYRDEISMKCIFEL